MNRVEEHADAPEVTTDPLKDPPPPVEQWAWEDPHDKECWRGCSPNGCGTHPTGTVELYGPRCVTDATEGHDCCRYVPGDLDEIHKAMARAYRLGQEHMRERAAHVAETTYVEVEDTSGHIRALPIHPTPPREDE